MTKSFLVGLFLTSLFLFGCGANRDSSSASSSSSGASATPGHSPGDHAATTQRIPAYFSNVADAKPFPAVLDPRQFSEPSVVKAYSYAKELPEIFSQQPCYCHCDAGNGHRSLLDCFATDHGATWTLCLKEGLLVKQLHEEGKGVSEIRDLIIRGEWKSVNLE